MTTNNPDNHLETEAMKLGGVPEGFKEISTEFFKFTKPGDKITGRLLIKDTIMPSKGSQRIGKYTLAGANGKNYTFLGSVMLDDLMKAAPIGATVLVIFTHEEQTDISKNKMKMFKVYTKN